MSVQQQLLEQLGKNLVFQFQESIEAVRASGRTSESIHEVATDFEVEVLAAPNIWALEDGRGPTGSGASKGNPTLFESIKDWMQYRSAFATLETKQKESVTWAITKKIHKEGFNPTLDKPLTKVLESINLNDLLREYIAYQTKVYSERVVESVEVLAV